MKILFLIVFFCIWTEASVLKIDENFTFTTSGDTQINFEDPNGALNASDILEGRGIVYPKQHAGFSKSIFWSRLDIQNTGNTPVAIVLRNIRAGTDKIDISLYREGKRVQTHSLGDLRSQQERSLIAPKSAFYVMIEPHETIKLVTRYQNTGSYDFLWEIFSTREYSSHNSFEIWFWGWFGGFIVAIMLYNLMLYVNTKRAIFLVYVIHSALLFWFQYAVNGVIYFLDTGIDLVFLTYSGWYIPFLMISALSLFIILFFEFHRTHKKLYYFLLTISATNFGLFVLFFYAYLYPNLFTYTQWFIGFTLLILIFFMGIGIYAVRQKYQGAWYYLIGEGSYILFFIYYDAILMGKTSSPYAMYIVPTGVLIEVTLFSLALGSWVKKLRLEHAKAECLIMDEARFTAIGKNIGMAVHQWKAPLSLLGSHVLYLKAKEYKGELLSDEIKAHINAMSDVIEHMKQTVNDIYDSCTDVKSVSSFLIYDTLDIALRFQNDRIILMNVDMVIDCPTDIDLVGSKHALTNVFMTLIDNSLTQFQFTQTPNPKIMIFVHKSEEYTNIVFEDNGGGITISPVSKVFEIDVSTKGSHGSGMGLALAKMMVEKRLRGTINVTNGSYGARFEIHIPLHKKPE
jgi:two-component system, sensor histidine kinase LadS